MKTPQDILREYWGHETFRPLQAEVINSILSGNDTIALLPTGGGKSVCFQIPALMLGGCCLVISPLVALMEDQVRQLKGMEITAAYLHSGLSRQQSVEILQQVTEGRCRFLYISPERLRNRLFIEFLEEFPLSLIAIDEAHCISQWGHDFRPDYLQIATLREIFPRVPMIAVTATATSEVLQDITLQLHLRNPQTFRRGFSRPNIFYSFLYTDNKHGALLETIRRTSGSTIIYCRSRKLTEEISRYLMGEQVKAVHYHAGMSRQDRLKASYDWLHNRSTIMVATTAFGMGIDKPDVRLVIHFDMPEHIEAWYQETGRAGRDGAASEALSLYNASDFKRQQDLLELRFPDESFLRQVYQSVCEFLQIPAGCEPDQEYPFDLSLFCERFHYKTAAASYAIRLLEQEGLWTFSESVFRPATAQFLVDRRDLDELGRHHPDLHYVCTAILRTYGSVYNFPTVISTARIARSIGIEQGEAHIILQRLNSLGILDYRSTAEDAWLHFHHYRVRKDHLLINTERIRKRKSIQEEKLQDINALFNTHTCRELLLLRYFGENATAPCGHCDNCRKQQKTSLPEGLKKQLLLRLKDPTALEELAGPKNGDRNQVVNILRALLEEGLIVRRQDGKFLRR